MTTTPNKYSKAIEALTLKVDDLIIEEAALNMSLQESVTSVGRFESLIKMDLLDEEIHAFQTVLAFLEKEGLE